LEGRSEGDVRQVSSRSVGVEEEFLLVEPETGQPRAVAGTVLAAAQQAAGADRRDGDGAALEFELKQQQLKTNSEPCRTRRDLL
jgi:carboxylate-amine ligase